MTLKHCIVHSVERTVTGAGVDTRLRDGENSPTGSAVSLFEQFKQCFQRSGAKQYGRFDPARADNPLPGWLREQTQGKSTFCTVSRRIMEHLQQRMDNHQEPFSAHIMIAVDTVMTQDQWYLFWIEHVDASHIDIDLEVAATRYIDSGKLHFGARLFIDEWLQQDSPKYLSVIASRGNKILTDAFVDFIGFNVGLDLVEDTTEFLQIVDQYMDTLPEETTADVKGRIVDYCVEQDKSGAPIIFDELSSQLDPSTPEQFAHFVTQQQKQPKSEIYADRNCLKRYTRFFGRDNAMSISFSSDLYGEEVVYDETAETLTIRRIPKSLKQQLLNQKKNLD